MNVVEIKDVLRRAFPRPVAHMAYLKALYENEVELRLLPWLCERNETAIDVGAYTGTYAVGLSIYAAYVIAVEPQPRQAANLRASMPKNVMVVEAALSSRIGKARMKLSSPGGGSMSTLDGSEARTVGWNEITVVLQRLDDLGAQNVGFIKIDVEGHEHEVLCGALKTLSTDRPNILIEAEERFRRNAVADVVDFLKDLGYEGFFVRGNKCRAVEEFDLQRDQALALLAGGKRSGYASYINNFIFVPRERRKRLPTLVPPAEQAMHASITTWLGMRR